MQAGDLKIRSSGKRMGPDPDHLFQCVIANLGLIMRIKTKPASWTLAVTKKAIDRVQKSARSVLVA